MRWRVKRAVSAPAFKKVLQFLKKVLAFWHQIWYYNLADFGKIKYGRLAQLVEHLLDVQEVTGSSPVPSTTKILRLSSEDFLFGGGTGLEQGGSDDASRQSKQSAQWAVA